MLVDIEPGTLNIDATKIREKITPRTRAIIPVHFAGQSCDICWLGDDYASQTGMLMRPDLWRRYIKPYLAEEVQLARKHGLYVLFHSCGAVRPILPDLIEIGVNALEVFQTSARLDES